MCLSMEEWRCNDGFCIDSAKVQNGIKDCPDGSDEPHGKNIVICFLINILNRCATHFTILQNCVRSLVFSCGGRTVLYLSWQVLHRLFCTDVARLII